MNPAARKTAAILGLGLVGVFVADRMTKSKNYPVSWGINSQLDQMNNAADLGHLEKGASGDKERSSGNSLKESS